MTSDDKMASEAETHAFFQSHEIVVTEKMDGEATTFYSDGFTHARSIDSKSHPSRDYVKELAARIGPELPVNMRVSGENLLATHSINYTALPSYFMVYNMWVNNDCLAWDETVEWAELLDLTVVPVLYRGMWPGREAIHDLWLEHKAIMEGTHGQTSEGYVVRSTAGFARESFGSHVFKWVRPNHVQTGSSTHWMFNVMTRNELFKSEEVKND